MITKNEMQQIVKFAIEFGRDYSNTTDPDDLTKLIVTAIEMWQTSGMRVENWIWCNSIVDSEGT